MPGAWKRSATSNVATGTLATRARKQDSHRFNTDETRLIRGQNTQSHDKTLLAMGFAMGVDADAPRRPRQAGAVLAAIAGGPAAARVVAAGQGPGGKDFVGPGAHGEHGRGDRQRLSPLHAIRAVVSLSRSPERLFAIPRHPRIGRGGLRSGRGHGRAGEAGPFSARGRQGHGSRPAMRARSAARHSAVASEMADPGGSNRAARRLSDPRQSPPSAIPV